MGIIACIGLIFLVFGFFLFPIFNSIYLFLNFLSTVLVFGSLLFIILYFPLKIMNESWMKDSFKERNEKAEKVMENIGEEMLVIDAEFEEQEKKKNPDWKKDLRASIDKEMMDSVVRK